MQTLMIERMEPGKYGQVYKLVIKLAKKQLEE